MEGYRRKPRRYTVHREVCGVQDRRERKDTRNEGKASAKNKVTEEGHLDLRGVKRRNRNET